jgi:importin subunit beta-1
VAELCKKIPAEGLSMYTNDMMQCLLQVIAPNNAKGKNAESHEEALMAIGALARTLGPHMAQYMDHLIAPLTAALQNTEDYHVCSAAVGLVGDLSRALEKRLLGHCDRIMMDLLNLLMSQQLHRSVKPPILSTFADIALAIGGEFARFLEHVMTMLHNAAQIDIDISNEDNFEYLTTLHENILEGYSGIVQALRDADKSSGGDQYVRLLTKHANNGQPVPYLDNIVFLLNQKIHCAENVDPAVLKAAVNLLGDLAQALPKDIRAIFSNQQFVHQLLTRAQNEGVDEEDIQFARRITQ